ncbi:RING-type domain-containing protein [Aphelenchoides besseyi]|nr:RING-type domain-containing protein [Aphelenchoides besseyi]
MLTSETGAAENGGGTVRKSPQTILPHNQENHVNPLEKIEQLLTCSICLDRYKTPKLLPCQHTYCLPCLDSYADTIHHNLKCPECRAEHAIPYDGAKGFPTNLTLAGFLDIHLEATNDTSEQIEAYIHRYNMERCKICDEKAELDICHHCERKACRECRSAHIEMLKRDLGRLLNQIRRLSNRVKEASEGMNKGMGQLESNAETTKTEIREYFQRYAGELKRREDHFLSEVDTFHQNEKRLMQSLQDVLDVERKNLSDACSWVDAALSGSLEVKDEELCRYKTVFVDGVEYLRSFQPDSEDLFSKKIRFSPGDDASKLPTAISNFGELTVSLPQFAGRYLPLEQQYLPRPLRMGLESDSYRTSYRSNLEESNQRQSKYRRALDDDTSPFRRRQPTNVDLEDESTNGSRNSRSNRLRVGNESGRSSPLNIPTNTNTNNTTGSNLSNWRSSYLNSTESSATNEVNGTATNSGSNKSTPLPSDDIQNRRQKTTDSANSKSKRSSLVLPGSESRRSETPTPVNGRPWIICTSDKTDEVIGTSANKTTDTKRQTPPANDTVVRLRNKPPIPRQQSSTDDKLTVRQSTAIDAARQRRSLIIESTTTKPTTEQVAASVETTTEVETPARRQKFKIISRSSSTQRNSSLKRTDSVDSLALRVNTVNGIGQPTAQMNASTSAISLSADSNLSISASTSGSTSSISEPQTAANAANGNAATSVFPSVASSTPPTSTSNTVEHSTNQPRLFGTSVGGVSGATTASSTTISGSQNGGSGDTPPLTPTSRAAWIERRRQRFLRSRTNPDIFEKPPVQRSVEASPPPHPSATTVALSSRVQLLLQELQLKNAIADNSTTQRLTSTNISNGTENSVERRSRFDVESGASASTRRFSAAGEREESRTRSRPRITRQPSGSSLSLSMSSTIDYGSKSKPRLVFGRRGDADGEFNWPRGVAAISGGEFAVADSSNHRIQIFNSNGRILRTIGSYGKSEAQLDSCADLCYNRMKQQLIVSDRYNHRIQIYDVIDGRFVRSFGKPGAGHAQFNNPWGVAVDEIDGSIYVVDKVELPFAKSSFGSKGELMGQFNHPLFIAIHRRTQNVFVSDSNNHRICVFDHDNVPIFSFGVEGFHTAQLKLPRGVAVDDQGYVVVADSGNNRVQVFLSSGEFICGFGSWGERLGQFKGIEGVTLMDGQIIPVLVNSVYK